jgi:uncharacterized damage-inducible protein DinB
MMLEAVRTLYAYSAWANTRILDTAERLKLQQFIAPTDGGESVRDILVHILSAQWTWLERWRGSPRPMPWNPAEFPYVATLRIRWSEVEDATNRYITELNAAELDSTLIYVNYQGETWSYPLWQAILHQANHATQHRSEAALLMTRFGCSPGNLDLLIYEDELAASRG